MKGPPSSGQLSASDFTVAENLLHLLVLAVYAPAAYYLAVVLVRRRLIV